MGKEVTDNEKRENNTQDNSESILLQFSLEIYYEMFDKLPINSIVQLRKVNGNLKAIAEHYLSRELKVKQIACGQNHTLILLERGRVFAMGSNEQKQSGFVDLKNRTLPTEIIGINRIETIVAGFKHSVLLSKENELWIMGDNADQQLAFQTKDPAPLSLQKVSQFQNVKTITASDFITAVIDETGTIHQVGKTAELKPYVFANEIRLLPAWVPLPNENLDIVDISVGKEHALLLTKEGIAYGFGTNQSGELGAGQAIAEYTKWTPLLQEKVRKIKATALGSLILTEAHELKAAGTNSERQLAPSNGVFYQFETIATDVAIFDANDRHTLYLQRDSACKLYGMGNNKFGQLGQEEESSLKKQDPDLEAQKSQQVDNTPSAPALMTHIKHTSTLAVNQVAYSYANKTNSFFQAIGLDLKPKMKLTWPRNQQENDWEASEDKWGDEDHDDESWDGPMTMPGA